MTTEQFEAELRKLKDTLSLTEKQIQKALEMHRKIKRGEISVKRIIPE